MAATGGTVAGIAVAAALAGGAGGIFGSALAKVIDDVHADRLRTQMERGGLLLWVHTRDAAHEDRAVAILQKHAARDVHVHELPTGHELVVRLGSELAKR